MFIEILLPVAAYLIGSFPYMLLLSRALGHDLTKERDYHIAMYREVGRLAGASGIIVDILKGVIPVLIGFCLGLDPHIVAAAAVMATFGQMWPVFQRFNGEKGNTTGFGATGTLTFSYGAWLIFVIAVAFFVIGFLVRTVPRFAAASTWYKRLSFDGPASNSMPIGMLLGFAAMPISAYVLQQPLWMILSLLLIFIGIIIRRLTAGIRKDISQRKSHTGCILINRFFLDRSYY
jgi:glycerol-3-phosphate acyltransferase PlsY